jgi:hydroxyacylglutathione hydrolase
MEVVMTTSLILKSASVGPWPMNSYGVICPETQQSLLIDPGAEPDTLLGLFGDSTPIGIVVTHGHRDHVEVLDEMKRRLKVPVSMHPGDTPLAHLEADIWLADGDTIPVGKHALRVIYTPGHTPGMVSLMLPDQRVVVGDTIFQGGPGKTWAPYYFALTMATMRNVVFQWPDDTLCFPGHGPSFRIGDERPAFEAFLQRPHPADLYGDVSWDM